ncbi:unnamed protein product [Sphagnum troendelagicum]|uniref:Uncharacterized protein n=1 Tax=Sphagnum troendelagicum TaxID=128251 RepID=A0ABP0U6X7_9BRYO
MMQYRPELGSIGLTLRYPSASQSRDHRDYFTDTANSQQTASYYTSCSTTNTTRQAFEDNNQRTSHFVACNTSYASLKPSRDQSSPVSTLSPPDVSTTATTTTTAAASVCGPVPSYQMQQQATSFHEARNIHMSFAAAKQQLYVQQTAAALGAGGAGRFPAAGGSAAGAEMSGEVVQMLQVLESALLDDDEDDDMNGSFHQGAAGSAGGADHHMSVSEAGSSWADAFVDILGAESCCTQQPLDQLKATAMEMQQPSVMSSSLKSLLETSQLERLLVTCAEAVTENDFQKANVVIAKLNHMVSIHGDPMQRLAAYMLEGLVARMVSSGGGLYKALKCKVAPAAGGGDLLSAMQVLYEVCPYFKFGYMAANGAIAEAFQNEDRVHIIDFEINQGVQWSTLIQALAARPGGPPHLRITGVDDPSSEMTPPGGLKLVGNRLRKLAQSVGVPFVFHAVEKKCPEVQAWMLERQHGEALAVNFALQLHHVPDESVCTTNPRDRMLQMVKSLGPKVVTLVEQEANTNTAPFLPRFIEAMKYYSAVFQSLDVTLGRDSHERINVEQQCLARDLVNVIACEGAERVERHEMLGKWRARMSMAGFRPRSLSASVNNTIKMLLEAYSDKYRLQEEGGALSLGWMNRSLIVASAWH